MPPKSFYADSPTPEPKPIEISFDSTRNGDRIGHDHLDYATITVAGYMVSIDKERIIVQLPTRVPNSYLGYGHVKKQVIFEETEIDYMGQMYRIFRFKK